MSNNSLKITVFLLIFCMLVPFAAGCAGGSGGDDTAPVTTAPEPVSPEKLAATPVIWSDNYSVTGDMFAYYFYKDYYDAVQYYYSSYYQYAGLDYTKDLKDQTNSQTGETWFSIFRSITAQNVIKYLYFAEAALDSGEDFAADVAASVEKDVGDLTSAAEAAGESVEDFIAYRFGDGVTLDAIRKAVELFCLGDRKYEADLASFSYDDADYDRYYSEHEEDFLYIDFRRVEVRADQQEYESDAEKEEAFAAAEKTAKEIASSKNLNEFVERGIAYYKSVNGEGDDALTDDEITQKVVNVTAEYAYNDQTDLGRWAFFGERRDGDVTMLDNGAGIYTVIYLDRAPYRKDNMTKNIRRIAFSADDYDGDVVKAKDKADAAFAAWQASGMTADDFQRIAREYAGSGGSLEENVDLGETTPYVQLWMYDSARKPGDCELIQDNGVYYMVYYEGDGMVSWKHAANDALLSADIDALFKGYQEKYTVEYDVDAMDMISGENAYVRAAKESGEKSE